MVVTNSLEICLGSRVRIWDFDIFPFSKPWETEGIKTLLKDFGSV